MSKTVNDIASMLMQQPEPEPVEESTGGTEETEVLESQTDEADYEEVDSDGEYEEAEDDDESEGSDRYVVKVDGEEIEITLEEALAGYQRDSDYRKKTMSVAEERKAVEAKAAEIDSTIAELKSFIKREEDNVDWEALRRDDPAEYLERKEALDAAKAAQEKAEAAQQKQLIEKQQAIVADESKKLIDAMGPTWDDEQRNADISLANEYLSKMGFSEQEIGRIVDHRAWKMIFDAAKASKFNETKTKVSKEVRKAPKSVKPGQKVPASERKRAKAKEALRSSNKNNAIDALADFLKL